MTDNETLIQALYVAMPADDYHDWLLRGASAFGGYRGGDRREAAEALAAYFAPTDDEAANARRRRNGYIVTTSASEIRRTILRRAS